MEQESTNPLPSDFIHAYSRLELELQHNIPRLPNQSIDIWRSLRALQARQEKHDRESLRKPFTKKWSKVWLKIAKQHGTGNRLKTFIKEQGTDWLGELATKGANPNFILSLLVRYLWVEEIPVHDTRHPNLKRWNDRLNHLQGAREAYDTFTRIGGEYHVLRSPSFEKTLEKLEQNTRNILSLRDLPGKIQHQPWDKINREIFTIIEHLRNTCGGPQWRILGELLKSAGAGRKTFGTKRLGPGENPSSFIRNRLDNFEKHHPKEAKYIVKRVLPLIPNRSFLFQIRAARFRK
jgi:hypothetical protein